MSKIIAFSLFGNRPMYINGALQNAAAVKIAYPGWQSRFYVGSDVDEKVISDLLELNAQIIRMDCSQGYMGTFWRFHAAADQSADAILFRDVDSRLSKREVSAVHEWLESGKAFHIMRDHPKHRVPMMAGMWGVRGKILPDIEQSIKRWLFLRKMTHPANLHWKGIDQLFLARVIYPEARDSAMIHSEFVQFDNEQCRSFPLPRKGVEYIGQVILENGETNIEMEQMLVNTGNIQLRYKDLYSIKSRVKNLLKRV